MKRKLVFTIVLMITACGRHDILNEAPGRYIFESVGAAWKAPAGDSVRGVIYVRDDGSVSMRDIPTEFLGGSGESISTSGSWSVSEDGACQALLNWSGRYCLKMTLDSDSGLDRIVFWSLYNDRKFITVFRDYESGQWADYVLSE